MIARRAFLLGLPLAVAGCAAQGIWATDDAVQRVAYRSDEAPYLRLFTVRNVGSGNGAHSALLINASQRVLFDPAGSWISSALAERNDLLYGFSPIEEARYLSYHARKTYYIVAQRIAVPAPVAEQAFALARDAGPVSKSMCTNSISRLLKQLPGFEGIRTSFFPEALERRFGALPGIETEMIYEDDPDDNRSLRDTTAPRVTL
ncbi:lipoprotein [Ketogulonicigenium robustum]|uniref:Lipoprotein n=1 Tax=Ketogulonicigenium robustum TaxID=92947 RepID=A0A1W6NX18_9RHOB|nr:hypothetical protein [Ketogulonicigenium robustum]ARO13741.1 lipoprotein [Ketogulonicigenium robustum]